MTKHNQTEAFDLDAALARLEAGPAGQGLRAAADALEPPAAAMRRLRQRIGDTGGAAPRRAPGRLANLLAPRRLAGSLGLAMIAALIVALLVARVPGRSVSAAELIEKAEQRAAVAVPPGKVRHIVRELIDVENGQTHKAIDEVWLAEGDGHLLLWQPARRAQPGSSLLYPLDSWLVNNEHVWYFSAEENTAYRAPYDACALSPAEWIGDPQFLAEARSSEYLRLIGEEELDGRTYAVIDIYETRLWVDPENGQIIQSRSAVDFEGGRHESTVKIVVDEVMDAPDAPAGLFAFDQPPGSRLVERERLCVNG
ncbi:MAG TPA: hypothetical protein VD886_01630 [Herpetosiphonaceae bacterium]|nr:hypothetical protein [Herpetosiphonaceae bacterium]